MEKNARQIAYFVTVVEQGTITKAAELLGLSQPALTKSLRRLEQTMSVDLLERGRHGVRPTVFGECLYEHAKRAETELDRAKDEIESLRLARVGTVAVGAVPVIAKDYMPQAVVRLMRTHPDITVWVTELRNSQLLPAFRKGQFDFVAGLLDAEELEDGFTIKVLFYDELVAAVRTDHPLTRLPRVEATDLLDYPWIYPTPGTAHRRRMDEFFQSARLTPPTATIFGGSNAFIKSILMETDFVAVLPENLLREQDIRGRLVGLSLNSSTLRRPIGIIHRGRQNLSPLARVLVADLVRACRQPGSEENFAGVLA